MFFPLREKARRPFVVWENCIWMRRSRNKETASGPSAERLAAADAANQRVNGSGSCCREDGNPDGSHVERFRPRTPLTRRCRWNAAVSPCALASLR